MKSAKAAIVLTTIVSGHGHESVSASAVEAIQALTETTNNARVGLATSGTFSSGFGIARMESMSAWWLWVMARDTSGRYVTDSLQVRAKLQLRADERIRTADPFITSEVLYQLSYVGN